ncbi:MAG TPA: aldo/keto reductase [Arsenicitalea sp.]|jgi:2,5-diketo-D-gluconate reductase A|nr:aldo/keto reductase [Arsenicitalea sp.]
MAQPSAAASAASSSADRSGPASIPLIKLNDGNSIPQLGFGVWQVPNDEVKPAVTEAIRAGYRSIDTAQGYDNEEGVGEAIRDGGVPREQLFITSKLRTKSMGYDEALRGFDESRQKLGLDYLDMFLIHWPLPARDRYVDTWKAFIKLKQDGLVRTIGVSNFLPEHIDRLIAETGVVPAINQIETHPQYQQRAVRDYHRQHNIQLESYSPLGSGAVLDNEEIAAIAKKHGKSPAQVIIRWHLQEGLVVIPKSVTPERIRENLQVFDFELDREDMAVIARLDDPANGKTGSKPEEFNDLY